MARLAPRATRPRAASAARRRDVGAVRLDPFHGRAVQQRLGLGQVGADHVRVGRQDTRPAPGRPRPRRCAARPAARWPRSARRRPRANPAAGSPAHQALLAGRPALDLGQQLPPLPRLPGRAGLVEHGDPAGALEQDGRGPGGARHRTPASSACSAVGQLAELSRAAGRQEGDDDGPVAEGPADPGHVDALATQRGHRRPGPVHAARDQDADRDGPVSGDIGINDQHADQHERRLTAGRDRGMANSPGRPAATATPPLRRDVLQTTSGVLQPVSPRRRTGRSTSRRSDLTRSRWWRPRS